MKFSILNYGLSLAVLLLLVSCFEKDEAVNPYPGEVFTIESNINEYLSYFNFETNEVKIVFALEDWQLAFEPDNEGWHILVNSGANWFILNTGQQDMGALYSDNEPANWHYDIQSRYPDSTAVGNWTFLQNDLREYTNEVYILGRLSANQYTQRKQIRFFYVDNEIYRFHYIDEETGIQDTVTITKNDSTAFVYYNFIGQNQLNPEPKKTQYDIVFCTYYDLATLFGVTIPYLVRGVLLNTSGVQAVCDSVTTYDQVRYETLGQYEFSGQRDVIGYRWKDVSVDINAGSAGYTVHRNMNYIVKTLEGNYYKMRFLSFSMDGESGFPQFEYTLLQPVN